MNSFNRMCIKILIITLLHIQRRFCGDNDNSDWTLVLDLDETAFSNGPVQFFDRSQKWEEWFDQPMKYYPGSYDFKFRPKIVEFLQDLSDEGWIIYTWTTSPQTWVEERKDLTNDNDKNLDTYQTLVSNLEEEVRKASNSEFNFAGSYYQADCDKDEKGNFFKDLEIIVREEKRDPKKMVMVDDRGAEHILPETMAGHVIQIEAFVNRDDQQQDNKLDEVKETLRGYKRQGYVGSPQAGCSICPVM